MKPKYEFEKDLGVDSLGCGIWRSYQLYAHGNNAEELVLASYITEIDQDGGDLSQYHMSEANDDVYEAALKVIKAEVGSE
jgi:hypothetical protein